MASSNRHWPSMFKSKPTNLTNDQCHFSGGEVERTPIPEPKPRWNPRPEQIGILEAIFNSGMVNPPRDEIQKIRARLQEYGHVGDANVFYWFQNRKSRTKNKRRRLQTPATTSSSTLMTNSVNQPNFYQLLNEPSFLHSSSSQGFSNLSWCVSEQESVGNCSNVLVADHDQLMLMNHGPLRKNHHDQLVIEKLPAPQQIISPTDQPVAPRNLQDLGRRPPQNKSVFMKDVCYEVATAPFNVREAFRDEATDLTHQNGAFYYLINPPDI